MKKRTSFIGAILSLIPLGQPLLIKTSLLLSTAGLVISIPEKAQAESADFYLRRAIQKYEKEDFNGALLDINKAIRINPNVSDFYGIRAAIYGRMLNYESSCADMRKAISMGDKIVPEYYGRFVKKGVC